MIIGAGVVGCAIAREDICCWIGVGY